MRLRLPGGVECVCGKRLGAFVILAAAWRRMRFKLRGGDALVLAAAANPHGRGSAIRSLEPDSWMSRTDGYPRLCRQARLGGRPGAGLQRRCYCGVRDGLIPLCKIVPDAH